MLELYWKKGVILKNNACRVPVLMIAILLLFGSFSFALDSCADVFFISYSTNALIPIWGEETSPGGSVITVKSFAQKFPFSFGTDKTSFFYVATEDQYKEGKKLAYAGEVFYKNEYGSGFDISYFKRAGDLRPLYADNGDSWLASFKANYSFSFNGRDAVTPVISISSQKPIAFGTPNGVGSTFIALTKTIDPDVPELQAGSVFLRTNEEILTQVGKGGLRYIGSCTLSCSDPDFKDQTQNTTCRSTLADGSDYCIGENDLAEYVCSPSTYCTAEKTECPYGCENGKCKSGDLAKCGDSDAQVDVLTKGHVNGNYANGTIFNYYDYCLGSTKIVEYYCDSNRVPKTQEQICPGSCENGKCVETSTQPTALSQPSCSETDGGRNYEVQGTCSDSTGSYRDYCGANGVVEYYCEQNSCKSVESPCPSCIAGACPKSALVPAGGGDFLQFAFIIVLILAVAIAAVMLKSKKHSHQKKGDEVEKI